jgi:hypothetical protein
VENERSFIPRLEAEAPIDAGFLEKYKNLAEEIIAEQGSLKSPADKLAVFNSLNEENLKDLGSVGYEKKEAIRNAFFKAKEYVDELCDGEKE